MSENIRPASLELDTKNRVSLLKGLMSQDAQAANTDNYEYIELELLDDVEDHPFSIEDEELQLLAESIKEVGILQPIVARLKPGGRYEILAGHRRKRAGLRAGLTHGPVKIMDVDDDMAVLIMTDTNLKVRVKIKPSEKARAYKMQMDVFERQGRRTDLMEDKKKWDAGQLVADNNDELRADVFRYVHLNDLIPELLDCVDNGELSFRAGVELSYLQRDEQEMLWELTEGKANSITVEKAELFKSLSKDNQLSAAAIRNTLRPAKAGNMDPGKLFGKAANKVKKQLLQREDFASVDVDPDELEAVILEAVNKYLETRPGGETDTYA